MEMRSILLDFRYGFRLLHRHAVLSVGVIVTLALGIGANTSLFTAVRAILLRPLPLPEPEQVTTLWETILPSGRGTVSLPDLNDWRAQSRAFEEIAGFRYVSFSLRAGEARERIPGAQVSPAFFRVMKARLRAGRAFAEGEDTPGKDNVVMIGEGLWKSHFQSDPDLVGKEISVNGQKPTVIGIVPASLRFPREDTKLWAPLVPDPKWIRAEHNLLAIGRLKHGVTVPQAQAEMNTIAQHMSAQYIENKTRGVLLIPLQEQLVAGVKQQLLVLMFLVGFVFLMACTNVVSLLLTRTAARQREIATRIAMGASRWRLARQFLVENLLLASLGGTLGWFSGVGALRLITALKPSRIPRLDELTPDSGVLAFAISISVAAGLVLTLTASIKAMGTNFQDSLKESGRSTTSGRRSRLVRNAIVVAEIAMAFMLLSSAALVIVSFSRIVRVDPGFNPTNVLTMRLSLPDAKYTDRHPASTFYNPLLQRIQALPGVQGAGLNAQLPLREYGLSYVFKIVGKPAPTPGHEPRADYRPVSEGYHRSMAIPLLRGRLFSAADTKSAPPVALVNDTFVKQYFPKEDPIGRDIQVRGEPVTTIVGVVADTRQGGLEFPIDPEIDVPYEQCANQGLAMAMSLVVRSSSEPASLAPAIRRAILEVDPDPAVFGVETMEEVMAKSIGDRRFTTLLMTAFAGLALILSTFGLYGVVSYGVKQRTHEIGIRVALGAEISKILGMIIGQGLLLTWIGSVVGLAGAFAARRLIGGLLYGVRPEDPLTLGVVALVLTVTAFFASYLPAQRALRIDPAEALRHE